VSRSIIIGADWTSSCWPSRNVERGPLRRRSAFKVDVGKKVVPVVQKIAPVAPPLIKGVAASKGIQMAEVEQSGFFDKIKDFGKKVISHPIVQDKVLPFVQQQGTKLVNDQLAKKNIPMQFAEQSGFFDKIKDFGKKVINSDVVKNQLLPMAQQQGTKLINDQLAKKNIPLSFAEESGFVDIINKAINIGKDVVPVLTPAMKDLIEKSKNLNIKDKNALLQHIFETGKSAFETGKNLVPIVKQHI